MLYTEETMAMVISIPLTFLPTPPHKDIGERVTFKSKRLSNDTQEIGVDIAQELAIAPKDIYKYLTVELGKMVDEGAVLAQKKGFMQTQVARAPKAGEVRRIDHTTGMLTLAVTDNQSHEFEISVIYKGTENGEVRVSVKQGIVAPLSIAISRSFSGTCSYCDEPSDIDEQSCEGRIVIAPSLSSIDLSKVCAFSPIAIITDRLVYYTSDIPQLQVKDAEVFRSIMRERFQKGLYIASARHCYLFNTQLDVDD